MINFKFGLTNPFVSSNWEMIYTAHRVLSEHKNIEFEYYHDSTEIAVVCVDISPYGRDHGGIVITVGLFGRIVTINFYDCRHWDYKRQEWFKVS